MTITAILRLIRLRQWVKNGFVLIPAFFAARILDQALVLDLLGAFLAFSLMASCVYVINDYVDRERDRQHPEKQHRPLASGVVSTRQATVLAVVLGGAALALAVLVQLHVAWLLLLYLGINILYSIWLKHIAIVDISIIASGFLLRIFAGGIAAQVPISRWLIVLTFLLALILALGKRRHEFLTQSEGRQSRPVLDGYNLPFIDLSMVFLAAVTVVAYLMYTISDEVVGRIGSEQLYVTSFFVVLGLLRFLQLALVFNRTASPTRVLLEDRFIQLMLMLWGGVFLYLLYF
ncbi:MAG: decaprenyl-phosphate phosphoribosyltransferase [Bacteroidota bacterium]